MVIVRAVRLGQYMSLVSAGVTLATAFVLGFTFAVVEA